MSDKKTVDILSFLSKTPAKGSKTQGKGTKKSSVEKTRDKIEVSRWDGEITRALSAQLIEKSEADMLRKKAMAKRKKMKPKVRARQKSIKAGLPGVAEPEGHMTFTPKFIKAISKDLSMIYSIQEQRKKRAKDI